MQIKRKSFYLSVLFGISIVLSSSEIYCMQENNFPKKILVRSLREIARHKIVNKLEVLDMIFAFIYMLMLPISINAYLTNKDLTPNDISHVLRFYALFSIFFLFISYVMIWAEIKEIKEFMADKKIRVRNVLKSGPQNKKDYIINLECSICLGTNGPLYSNSNTNCPHLYHSSCLSQWLNTSNNIDKPGMLKCVICKQSLNCLLIKEDESKKDV